MKAHMRAVREINPAAIRDNARIIKGMLPEETQLLAVVKADGYGHGMAEAAKAAAGGGASCFSVATVEEGVELRKLGFEQPILIFGAVFGGGISEAIEHGLSFTVYDHEQAEEISRHAGLAGKTAAVHIKLDTGMSRLGFMARDIFGETQAVIETQKIAALHNIKVDGIYSHLAASESDKSFTALQLASFLEVTDRLAASGIKPVRHIANSGAILYHPEAHLDMVRAGIILYGLPPESNAGGAAHLAKLGIRPALCLKSRVASVKNIPANATVGYSRTYKAPQSFDCAVVTIGYADGYSRGLSNKGSVLVNGRRARIVGNVCMDQTMVDVSGIDVKPGDEVVLIGESGGEKITAEELALLQGTINYEVVTTISERVPKIFL